MLIKDDFMTIYLQLFFGYILITDFIFRAKWSGQVKIGAIYELCTFVGQEDRKLESMIR